MITHCLRQERGFYRDTLLLMLPLVLQNLVTNFMALADTFMVGRLGEVELAAVSSANSLFYVVNLLIFGIQSGAGVLVAQYHGRGNLAAINRVMGMGYFVSLAFSTLVALCSFFFPVSIMKVLTNNADLWTPGADYARIVGFSYVCMAASGVYIAVQRSMGNPRLGAVLLTASGAMNIVLNYMLIYGAWGAPAMGCAGAALATLISRAFEVVVVVIYALRSRRLPLSFGDMLRPGRQIASDFMRYSLPVTLNEGLWSLATALFTVIMGHMDNSTPILAAYTIAGNIDKMCSVALLASGNTAAIIIGREIGLGRVQPGAAAARARHAAGRLRLPADEHLPPGRAHRQIYAAADGLRAAAARRQPLQRGGRVPRRRGRALRPAGGRGAALLPLRHLRRPLRAGVRARHRGGLCLHRL